MILDLEEERQRHAQDTAEGDDVTYMLEKERERLTQQVRCTSVAADYPAHGNPGPRVLRQGAERWITPPHLTSIRGLAPL